MNPDTRTLHRDGDDQPPTRSLPPSAMQTLPDAESAHPDPRLVFVQTEAGAEAIRHRSQRVSLPARRLLNVFDGIRPIGQLPPVVRADEMAALVKELEGQGLIALVTVRSETTNDAQAHPDVRLARIKRSLAGVFERELGVQASVLEARVQDCVNLVVLRNVLREVIALVATRKDAAAAERIAAAVKAHGPF